MRAWVAYTIGGAVLFGLSRVARAAAQVGEFPTVSDSTMDPLTQVYQDIAEAIAFAEGFFAEGNTLPRQLNNPADIMGSNGTLRRYGTLDDGWAAARAQVRSMLTTSRLYRPEMPIIQVAPIYISGKAETTGPAVTGWARAVAQRLGVSITDSFADYALSQGVSL